MRNKFLFHFISMVVVLAGGVQAAPKETDRLTELSRSKSVAPNHKRMVQHYRDQRDGRIKMKEKRARLKGKTPTK